MPENFALLLKTVIFYFGFALLNLDLYNFYERIFRGYGLGYG